MIKVIACQIFQTYIGQFTNTNYEIEYLEVKQHLRPQHLSLQIQNIIDQSSQYEKILILYGLCGNMLLNIQAKNRPIYVVRVHDCLSILLGKKRYLKYFEKRKSASWTCQSLCDLNENQLSIDIYLEWVDKYGQEEADYLKEVLIEKPQIYIMFDETDKYSSNYKEIIKGDNQFLKSLLSFKSEELIVLKANEKLYLTNDERVVDKRFHHC